MAERPRASEWTRTGRRPGSAPRFGTRSALTTSYFLMGTAALQTMFRVSESYSESTARGNRALASVFVILGVGAAPVALLMVTLWLTSLPRCLALQRTMPPGTIVMVSRVTQGYWEALAQLVPPGALGRRIHQASITIDDAGLTVWKGWRHPYPVAQIKLADIVSANFEVATMKGYRFKVVVVTVRNGLSVTEIPFALFTIFGSLGLRAINRAQRKVVLERLRSAI